MKNAIITGIAMLMLIGFSSCKKNIGIKGNGNIITQDRDVSGFQKISLECAADIYLIQGADFSVKVETDDNVMPYVETKKVGNTLEIEMKKGMNLRGNTTVKIYITMPELKSVDISGSGEVYGNDTWNSDNLDLTISGSGDMDFENLNANSLDVNISGSGDIAIVGTDTLTNENINISGSGKLRLFQIVTMNSDINISGSSNTEVNVVSKIDARISGSGDIVYKGNPIIDSNISGSGDIRPY